MATVNTFDQEWSTSLCSWCGGPDTTDGCKTCLVTACCPCIQYGWNSEKLAPGTAAFAGECLTAGLVWAILAYMVGVPCVIQMGTRQAIRRKYNLKPVPCNDFCATWCCSSCTLCQEHYQLTGAHNTKPTV